MISGWYSKVGTILDGGCISDKIVVIILGPLWIVSVLPSVVVEAVVPLVVDSVVGGIVTVVVSDMDVVDGDCALEDVVVASVEAVVLIV